MIFRFFQPSTYNRTEKYRRPVFPFLAISLVTFFGFMASTASVRAEEGNSYQTPTSMPNAQFTLPPSEEPVILEPGNRAQLISPVNIELITKPGDDGLVRIELIGQDNRYIFRRLLNYRAYIGKTLLIKQVIPFEIREDEKARLQVVLEDAKGRMTFLSSVEITLLGLRGRESTGETSVIPRFRIDQPDGSATVTGKSLNFVCGLKPINNTPVVVEMVAADGHTIVSRLVPISMPLDQTAYTTIEANLPFKVPSSTQVTLRVRQESNNLIKGTVLMWSRKITVISD